MEYCNSVKSVKYISANVQQIALNLPATALTAFFALCQNDPFAKTPVVLVLRRLYAVHPTQDECFFFCMLLVNVPGPTFSQQLKTVNDVTHATFRSACQALNLLVNDRHWDASITWNYSIDTSGRNKSLSEIFYFVAIHKNFKINYKYACPAAKRSISWNTLTSIVGNWERKSAVDLTTGRGMPRNANARTAVENRCAYYHFAKYQPAKTLQQYAACSKKLMSNVIKATILTGSLKGKDVLIPCIPKIRTDMPFQFKRLQFPIQLAFAFTINKAQGQSLELCSLDLGTYCFSYGQSYTECFRVSKADNLYIYTDNGTTKNIVYPQVL
ncbi:unnamed protein product [Onchocerca ochengi]|uniref:ATP-dependent DNA helicase n=1 Tax=Onchocerca ochengi TaxID=42157 RepID=A0A182EPU8_ONCOC|nr:unnamed protein product [Onchocerca ochengi]